jgi:hypothetical protein
MPRPKSDITGKQIIVSARVTMSQRDAFKQLGGAAWLRKQLAAELDRQWSVQHSTSFGSRIMNRVLGR